MSKESIKKYGTRTMLVCTLVLSLGGSAAAKSFGCSELFEAMAWGNRAELASGLSPEPSGAARDFQRWRSWALASRAWSLSALAPTLEDVAVGARMPQQKGHPDGTGSCEALAWRLQTQGAWGPQFMIPHMQRAVDELALMDQNLADAEAVRLVRQERERVERRVAAGADQH